jgi:hypothetical protein
VAVIATALSLLAGAAAGCSTTQEKAEKQQARAEHILNARKERQDRKKKEKHSKSGHENEKSGT